MSVAICWFRRNLRLDDNAPLTAALRNADAIVPLFIREGDGAPDRPGPARRAVLEDAVADLAEALRAKGSRLIVREGPPASLLATLSRETGSDAVFAAADHEPSTARPDTAAGKALEAIGARLRLVEDHYLVSPAALTSGSGKPFTAFAPFFRRWLERDKEPPFHEPAAIPTPAAVLSPAFGTASTGGPAGFSRDEATRDVPRGGLSEANRLLDAFLGGALAGYADRRDRPDLPGTSRLSPHLRSGALGVRRLFSGVREVRKIAETAKKRSVDAFVRELAFRDFYASTLRSFPELATRSFRAGFERFPWSSGEEEERRLALWADGRTGYPLVDAAMRQLLREGWIHNRLRMISASFLAKHLLVDWRRGEEWFRRHLADADVASNAGGWQWSAGTGPDAPPFFRIFNPVLQGVKFDPEGAYVRRWLPELRSVMPARPAEIHSPWALPSPPPDYPSPVVDHALARSRALAAFGTLRS